MVTTDETEARTSTLAQLITRLPRPSARLNRPCSADLEELLMQCLAKLPEQRPPTAEALDEALGRCVSAGTWTLVEAKTWWRANVPAQELPPQATMPEKTLVIASRC